MRWYTEEQVRGMDETLCRLHSLGTVVRQLSTMECQKPDLTALADVGDLIADTAMDMLNLVQDGKMIVGSGGGSEIRTHGTTRVQRFSRPSLSTTQPFLRLGSTIASDYRQKALLVYRIGPFR